MLLLARAFLREAGGGSGPGPVLDPGAERWLLRHPFPGNVRELKCLVLGAAALSGDGVIRLEDLSEGAGGELPPCGPPSRPARAGPGDPRPAAGEAVLVALRSAGPAPTSFLVRETGLPRRTVQRALAELVRCGEVRRGGRGPATRYLAAGP